MELNNTAEMIAAIELRQSELKRDNENCVPTFVNSYTLLNNDKIPEDLDQSEDLHDPNNESLNFDELNLDPITEEEVSLCNKESDNFDELNLDPITEEEVSLYNKESDKLVSFPKLSEFSELSNCCCSKFNEKGQEAINQAKASNHLIEFAATLPPPKERKKVLSENSTVSNSDTWIKYVYRTAFFIPDNQLLGLKFQSFRQQVSTYRDSLIERSDQRSKKTSVKHKNHVEEQEQSEKLDFSNNNSSNLVNSTKQNLEDLTQQKKEKIMQIWKQSYINEDCFQEAVSILDWFKHNGKLDAEKYKICLKELQDY